MSAKKNCITDKNLQPQDYQNYRLCKKEVLRYAIEGFVAAVCFLCFFYRMLLILPMGIAGAAFYCRWKKGLLCENRKHLLQQQFRDWINAASGHLQSGSSVENAFVRAGRELALLYEAETDIRREVQSMEHLLANNIPLEKILADLGERSGMEDIRNFADVFAVGKRSGGNLREMIENCCQIIAMKAEVEREIRTLLHGKMMEQKVMCLIPFGIICYISFSSPGYFDALYHTCAGICIMTGCLVSYLFSVWISLRIVHIEV